MRSSLPQVTEKDENRRTRPNQVDHLTTLLGQKDKKHFWQRGTDGKLIPKEMTIEYEDVETGKMKKDTFLSVRAVLQAFRIFLFS